MIHTCFLMGFSSTIINKEFAGRSFEHRLFVNARIIKIVYSRYHGEKELSMQSESRVMTSNGFCESSNSE
jgi:hypothetical protein